MTKIFIKTFLWLTKFLIIFNISNNCFGENFTILKPESSFVPDTHFYNESGEKVFLDQFEGKTILLCFWATWCGSCIDELPSLDVLQKDFRKMPFEIIAVSEDFNGIEAAKAHFAKYGIRHLKLYHDYKNELFKAMSVVGLPTTFLISPEGKIKIIFKGIVKWHDDKIRELLLLEIDGTHPLPKNSYDTTVLNKKVINDKIENSSVMRHDEILSVKNPNKQEENNENNK